MLRYMHVAFTTIHCKILKLPCVYMYIKNQNEKLRTHNNNNNFICAHNKILQSI